MAGGAGNDLYYVDNTGDVVTENSNEGTDTISSSVSYTLSDNVENLTLTGTGSISGTGNDLDNYIIGHSGSNIIDGGSGADSMIGGVGNDLYYVDNTSDVVTENVSAGNDTISSSVSYTLSDNVEHLILTGTSAIDGTGNDLNNNITGNSAANTLSGEAGNDIIDGGEGADSMLGGVGNDVYYVDNINDVIAEIPMKEPILFILL